MGQLEEHYARSGAPVPPRALTEHERIDFWARKCGLPEKVRSQLQALRVWRNAAQHRDEERWRRDGPCSAAKLSRHLAELGEAIVAVVTKR